MAPVLRQHGQPFEGKGRGREHEEGGRVGWFTLPHNKAERWRKCRVKAPRIVPVWWPEWWTGTLSPAASWTDGCGSLWDSPGVSEPVLATDLFTLFKKKMRDNCYSFFLVLLNVAAEKNPVLFAS